MKSPFLIAVSSCQPDQKNGRNEAIRQGWGKIADEQGVNYILTVGAHPVTLGPHEVGCSAFDDYVNLGYKTYFNAQYALEHGYRAMVQCFTDTYFSIPRLIRFYADEELQAALVGNFFFPGHEEDHPCGGSGYFMRRDALELIAATPVDPKLYTIRHHAEDRWVSYLCRQAGLDWKHDPRFDHESRGGGVSLHNANISNHLSFGHRYDPKWQQLERQQELTGEAWDHAKLRPPPLPQRPRNRPFAVPRPTPR